MDERRGLDGSASFHIVFRQVWKGFYHNQFFLSLSVSLFSWYLLVQILISLKLSKTRLLHWDCALIGRRALCTPCASFSLRAFDVLPSSTNQTTNGRFQTSQVDRCIWSQGPQLALGMWNRSCFWQNGAVYGSSWVTALRPNCPSHLINSDTMSWGHTGPRHDV